MKTYTVWKKLRLEVDIEAESEEDAIAIMLEMNDNTFGVYDCDYGVVNGDNE